MRADCFCTSSRTHYRGRYGRRCPRTRSACTTRRSSRCRTCSPGPRTTRWLPCPGSPQWCERRLPDRPSALFRTEAPRGALGPGPWSARPPTPWFRSSGACEEEVALRLSSRAPRPLPAPRPALCCCPARLIVTFPAIFHLDCGTAAGTRGAEGAGPAV